MSSLLTNQLEKIDKLIINGKSNNAMKFLEEILSKDMSEKEKVAYNSYKIRIFNLLGKYQEAINLVEEILKLVKKQKTSIEKADILFQKGIALAYLKKKEEVKIVIKEIEAILSELDNITSENKNRIKALIYKLQSRITSSYKESKKFLKIAQNCKKFAEKSMDKRLINYSILAQAYAYYHLDEKEKSRDLLEEAFKQASSFGYLKGQEDSLWAMSYYESNREKSLDYAEKAMSLHEKVDSRHRTFYHLRYLSCVQVQNSEFEKAFSTLRKTEKYMEKDNEYKYQVYFVYARIFSMKGEFNLAYENILRALEIVKKHENKKVIATCLYDLVILAIDLENPDLAEEHLEELSVISKELDFEKITQKHLLASALILKANKGLRDWSKAIEILEKLIEDEALDSTQYIIVSLNLCELLIREIELTGVVDLLDNIQTHLTQLHEIAENQKIHWLLIEILRLKSQIALLVFDIIKARELLEAALRVSQDKGIEKLTVEILNEQIEIEEKIVILEKLQEINAPLIETLKHVHLLNNIVDINLKTANVKTCSGNKNTLEYRKLFSLKI